VADVFLRAVTDLDTAAREVAAAVVAAVAAAAVEEVAAAAAEVADKGKPGTEGRGFNVEQ
jgi:hypothetical protein